MRKESRPYRRTLALLAMIWLGPAVAAAAPFIAPGDAVLRSDLQQLADAGFLPEAVLVWPVSWNDVLTGIEGIAPANPVTAAALARVRQRASVEAVTGGPFARVRIGVTDDPLSIRSFESTLREDGEVELSLSWTGNRLASEIVLTRVMDSPDDSFRTDGSYISLAVGNWALVGGSPERWWGPGWQGALAISTNARPVQQLAIQRIASKPMQMPGFRWIGPWSFVSFMGELDDERAINDSLLFGIRATARPLPRLEIGITRTAQWCGEGRPCGFGALTDLLAGKDNRGVNIDAEEEPGNQLGGFDVRWSLPQRPVAAYMQWIGEDSRRNSARIGSWLRQVGAERWGALPWTGWSHHTYIEFANTVCGTGGVGSGDNKYNCGYEHGTFISGYRYEGRSIGHSIDNDSTSVSVGTTVAGPDKRSWRAVFHRAEINKGTPSMQPHGLSSTAADYSALSVTHARPLPVGEIRIQARVERFDGFNGSESRTGSSLMLEWRFGY